MMNKTMPESAEKNNSKKKGQTGQKPIFFSSLVFEGLNTPTCSLFLVTKPEFIIGCSPDCDAILHYSKEISRHHAVILWDNGSYSIKDLNSTNYTFLNGKILTPEQKYPIKNGDQITISSFVYAIKEINF